MPAECVFEEEVGWEWAGEGAAFVGEGGFFEGDEVAFGVGPLFGGEGDEAGAGEGVEEGVEDFAVGGWVLRRAPVESSVWSLPVARDGAIESAKDGAELAVFFGGGGAEGLGGGVLRGAEVAVAAGAEAVGGVAEVLDEGGHAALRGFGELDHAVDLVAAEGDLVVVAFAPCGAAWERLRWRGRCRPCRWWRRLGR